MAEKKYISSVKIDVDPEQEPKVYVIKDAEARALLQSLFSDEIIIDCGGAPIENEE